MVGVRNDLGPPDQHRAETGRRPTGRVVTVRAEKLLGQVVMSVAGTRKVIIMGAAGRDFHDFNTYWRDNPAFEVVAFTAAQIPDIEGRVYPPELAGPRYPKGIHIYAESDIQKLIQKHDVDLVALSLIHI